MAGLGDTQAPRSGAPELDETTAPPVRPEPDPLATAVSATPQWDAPGEREAAGPLRIGRFVILREVGRGAMGVVYAGYDEELDRRVALKLVQSSGHDDPSFGRAQLLREAQALARLAHPNVVAVHEAGEFAGAVFIAMEYVDGVDLQRWLAYAPRSWREIVDALRQAGEGLRAAHDVGLVHRDFKPSNVLVGADGRVRVADFGLATRRGKTGPSGHVSKATGTLTTADALATLAGSGALIGTPAYMAPEQLRREPATAASDQFAFCVTLYEALHGRRPFTGDTLEVLAEHVLHAEPPAVSPDPRVPQWLHALLLRGLAKDPARRFSGMAELLALLAHDPEAERRQRRRRLLQIAVAVTATVVVVLGGVAATRAIVRAAHERRAEARLEVLREQLAALTVARKRDEAARLFAAFAALPDNRGTAALARAYREWGEAQTDPAAAIDAHAGAYIAARTREDQAAALRNLALRLADTRNFTASAAALAALDAHAPELAADPELAGLRLAAALDRRDLPAARAALDRLPSDDPRRSYGHVLENLSFGTPISQAAIGQRPGSDHEFILGDFEGDGRLELATHADQRGSAVVLRADTSLTRLAEVPIGPLVLAPRIVPPALTGAPLLLLGVDNPGAPGDAIVRYGLYPVGGGAPLYRWTDSAILGAAVTDLDGDGRVALYTGSGPYARRLRQIDLDPAGQWQYRSPHPPTDAAGSDVGSIEAGDLDGDGRPELVVVAGPWSAYDLRVLTAGDDGQLRLLARRSLGFIQSVKLLRIGGEQRIAATKIDQYPAPGRFSEARPYGEPAGLYVLALDGDTLATRQFIPAPEDPSRGAGARWLYNADLDGDHVDDLLALAPPELALYRSDGEALQEPLRLSGLYLRAVADFDADPAAELLVSLPGASDGYFIVGAGDVPLPPIARPAPEARPIGDVQDPALVDAWRHAEELAALGLPRRSADELAAIARLSGHAHEDMLLRAADLYAAAGEHAAAAEHYLAAAARPELAAGALAGAITSQRELGDYAAALELAIRRAALPGLDLRVRRDAEAELDTLRRATAERPQLALRFDRPLDPAWRIYDPLSFARSPGDQSLSLQTSSERVIAEYPLEWDGGTAALTVDAALGDLEWGTNLTIAVTPVDSDDIYLGVRFESRNRSERPDQQVLPVSGPNGAAAFWVGTIEPGESRRFRLGMRHFPDLGTAHAEIALDGGEPRRVLLKHPIEPPPPGPLRLRILNRPVQPDSVADLQVFAVELSGLRRADPPPADPSQEVARLVAEQEIDAALERLAAAPKAGHEALWRIDLLARAGRLDEAAARLRDELAGLPDDHPFHARLSQRLMRDPDNFVLAARRALGPALYDIFLDPGRNEVLWRPARVRHHLADLADLPREPPERGGPEALRHHRSALLLRGLAWQRAGRDDLSVRDLEAALPLLEAPDDGPMRKYVLRRLVDASIRLRDPARARRWITAALVESATADLLLEGLRLRPGVDAIFTSADWARFEALTRR
ncbi:Serine/threonine protein kinase [Nannocystis exedens]|uniref:Serine/threonine protein kinase n=1 Tax=Nannocystis exedens TaxID=54 RepID=A0A1I1XQQ2_9BACT|nr:protein kinase [Nannocystis exedens]PCC73294.1 serine/threonine protein kinase [Nannocystis exedens]SFE08938.1 Serine/threonine protein kinase [Nannocystis exedens]